MKKSFYIVHAILFLLVVAVTYYFSFATMGVRETVAITQIKLHPVAFFIIRFLINMVAYANVFILAFFINAIFFKKSMEKTTIRKSYSVSAACFVVCSFAFIGYHIMRAFQA